MGSYVAMAHYIDPISGEKHGEHIIFDRTLKDRLPDHPIAIGFELTNEHRKLHEDGYIALVAIDQSKSTGTRPDQVYRLGKALHVKREALKQILDISDDHLALALIWVDMEIIDTITLMANVADGDDDAEQAE